MKKSLLIGAAIVGGLLYLYQEGVSTTPGVGDPSDTNPDGTAADGTDANVLDDVRAMIGVPDYINAWADCNTQREGWFPGSRSYRNNNPGNLEIDGDLGREAGGPMGLFSSYTAGRNALIADLTAKVRKYGTWTLYQVVARYAPPSENDTSAYASGVAQALYVTPATVVGTIAGIWSDQGYTWTPMQFAGAPTISVNTPDASSDQTPVYSDGQTPSDPGSMSLSDLYLENQTGFDPGTVDASMFDLTGGS